MRWPAVSGGRDSVAGGSDRGAQIAGMDGRQGSQ